jgi:hypothetical protein
LLLPGAGDGCLACRRPPPGHDPQFLTREGQHQRERRFHKIVQRAKARWVIERDYEELKQEIGLDHYEGRGWRGFHHHASLCIAAYGFLIAERCLFPPRRQFIRERIKTPALPRGFRPRGAAHPT